MHTLDLIGNTPLIELQGLDTGCCKLFAKLECQNPGGSIKDRIALSMIDDAEQRGLIKPGDTLVEATAGNTGIALALVAAQRGYQLTLVMPDKMSHDKVAHAEALGATVIITRSDVGRGHPDYYVDRAKTLTREIPNAWHVDQFSNPANPRAHELTTAPEIWKQMEHQLDAVVVGVGSGGTLGGLTNYFSKHAPHLEMVLADPVGSILSHYVKTGEVLQESGSWLVEGIGEDFIPDNANFSMVRAAYAISDKESLLAARELLRSNGIMAGSSSGTLLAAALRFCQEQKSPKRVVTFICDSGSKYLSKLYNDLWLREHGVITATQEGNLSDLIARRYDDGSVVSLKSDETLATAYSRMRQHDVSQLPVLDGSKIVGIVDESDVLFAVYKNGNAFTQPVAKVMTRELRTLDSNDPISSLPPLFREGLVAVVTRDEHFLGIITKVDFLQYLKNI